MIELAFFSYTAVMSITPGPNNLMLAASGVNHGFRKTLPHIWGITFGCSVQLLLLSLALGSFLRAFQSVRPFLAVAGCLYLLWLSWKTATASKLKDVKEKRPLGFGGAAFFQVLNPKAWVMAINTSLLFIPPDMPLVQGLPLLVGLYALINLPCISLWAFSGDRLRRWLSQGRALMIFNITMGSLMGLTALWLLAEEIFLPR